MPEALGIERNRRVAHWGGAAVALGTLALMLATEPRLAIVWDEGYTLGREARVRAWFQLIANPNLARSWRDPIEFDLAPADRPEAPPLPRPDFARLESRSDLFRPDVLAWFWPFAREEPHGHPPFYAMVGLLGDLLAPSWDVLPRARLGPILAFSLTAGAVFAFLARRGGLTAGAVGAAAWALHSHLFAMGHYAHYDGLLSALWVGSILAFSLAMERQEGYVDKVRPRWVRVVVFGVLAGWAADTKFTGWLLFIPFVAWTVLSRDRRAWQTLAVGGLVAALTLYAFNPPFWANPVEGVRRFLASNLTRSQTIPLPVLFLGKVVKTPILSLPWFNTLLWTGAATPVGVLLLALVGAVWSARQTISQAGHWPRLTLVGPPWGGGSDSLPFPPGEGARNSPFGGGSGWEGDGSSSDLETPPGGARCPR